MGSYFHVIERKVGGNLDAFRRELGRLRESGHFHRDRKWYRLLIWKQGTASQGIQARPQD